MVQAAAEGSIDFSKAELWGRRWNSKVYKILGYLYDRNSREQMQILHRQNVGYMASKSLTQESFDRISKLNSNLYDRIVDTYYPSVAQKSTQKSDIDKYTKLWEDQYGDMNDPEVKAKIEATARMLLGSAA
jgi:hypothetical protein